MMATRPDSRATPVAIPAPVSRATPFPDSSSARRRSTRRTSPTYAKRYRDHQQNDLPERVLARRCQAEGNQHNADNELNQDRRGQGADNDVGGTESDDPLRSAAFPIGRAAGLTVSAGEP